MHPAIQISFEGVQHSDAIENHIRSEMENLSDVDVNITSSTIVVVPPRPKHFSGDPYRLRVRLTVEGTPDINVNHDPGPGKRHDAMQIAIRDTFRIVRRRLEDVIRKKT
jgi:putative sigma-54 modulation protein